MPFVNHGAPAYWMQRSLWKSGFHLENFPGNHGGYILHRGRSSIHATLKYNRGSSYSTVHNHLPHYMGVPGGDKIWKSIEEKYTELLKPESEADLINYLNNKLNISAECRRAQ